MAEPRPSSDRGNVLAQKAGPLPVWAWALAGGVLIFAVYRYRQAKAAASSAAQTLNLPANADVGMASQGTPLGGWGGGGGSSGGTSAGGPAPSSTGTSGAGVDGQAVPPTATSLPLSPNGTAVPTVGSSGQPIGVPQSGDIALPQPSQNNQAGTLADAQANLGPGQTGILPNGLRVTRTTLPNGSVSYVYS